MLKDMTFDLPPLAPQFSIFVPLAEHKIVFCLTPKVASSGIMEALHSYYGVTLERPYHANSVLNWYKLDQVKKFIPDWARVMFVRNPFDRLVGCYEYHIMRTKVQASANMRRVGFTPDMSFDEFLKLVLKNPQADSHYALQVWQTDRSDYVGKLEFMSDEWKELKNLIDVNLPALKVSNKTHRNVTDYREYFSPEQRVRIESVYSHDFEAFDYTF